MVKHLIESKKKNYIYINNIINNNNNNKLNTLKTNKIKIYIKFFFFFFFYFILNKKKSNHDKKYCHVTQLRRKKISYTFCFVYKIIVMACFVLHYYKIL